MGITSIYVGNRVKGLVLAYIELAGFEAVIEASENAIVGLSIFTLG